MMFSPDIRTKIEQYRACVAEAAQHVNLVSLKDLADPAFFLERHVHDSAQLVPYIPAHVSELVDVGSGAGLPGVILALMQPRHVHLVEPRRKRAEFLREVVQALNLNATVHACTVEAFPVPSGCTMFVSRAFRPLHKALSSLMPHIRSDTIYCCLKGQSYAEEIEEARRTWRFDLAHYPSLTHPKGRVLYLTSIERRV